MSDLSTAQQGARFNCKFDLSIVEVSSCIQIKKSPCASSFRPLHAKKISGDDLLRHDSGHVGQTEIAPAIAISQPLVIEAEQMEDGRVEIVDVHAVFDGVVGDVVRGAVNELSLEAAADLITARLSGTGRSAHPARRMRLHSFPHSFLRPFADFNGRQPAEEQDPDGCYDHRRGALGVW